MAELNAQPPAAPALNESPSQGTRRAHGRSTETLPLPSQVPPPTSLRSRPFLFGAMVFACLLTIFTPTIRALVDDAYQMAMEIALPDVKDGIDVREDHWSGENDADRTLQIRFQLFKGNDYAFWIATEDETAPIDMAILLDEEGNEIRTKQRIEGHMAALRFKPVSTGTYYLQFRFKGNSKRSWAVAYGYK